MSDIDPKVYAMLADVFAQYYRRKDDQENFYKSGLTYLAYTPAEELSDEEKLQWSTKLGMAVLLGKKIFNVAELVSLRPQLTLCCVVGQGNSEITRELRL